MVRTQTKAQSFYYSPNFDMNHAYANLVKYYPPLSQYNR